MANIEVDTLNDTCWEKCDDFEIEGTSFFDDGMMYRKIYRCENVDKCRRIRQAIEEELRQENK